MHVGSQGPVLWRVDPDKFAIDRIRSTDVSWDLQQMRSWACAYNDRMAHVRSIGMLPASALQEQIIELILQKPQRGKVDQIYQTKIIHNRPQLEGMAYDGDYLVDTIPCRNSWPGPLRAANHTVAAAWHEFLATHD